MTTGTRLVEELERAIDAHLDTATARDRVGRTTDGDVHRALAARLRARAAWVRELERMTTTPGANAKMVEAIRLLTDPDLGEAPPLAVEPRTGERWRLGDCGCEGVIGHGAIRTGDALAYNLDPATDSGCGGDPTLGHWGVVPGMPGVERLSAAPGEGTVGAVEGQGPSADSVPRAAPVKPEGGRP